MSDIPAVAPRETQTELDDVVILKEAADLFEACADDVAGHPSEKQFMFHAQRLRRVVARLEGERGSV
jgi:hypothetical protein